MKKFLAGILFGGILVFSITGYADSLIGKQIDATFPLFINNEQSPKNVVSIEGTSYLPVRSAGEMFGYDVEFTNGTVYLDAKGIGIMKSEEDIIYEDTSNINQNKNSNLQEKKLELAMKSGRILKYDSNSLEIAWEGQKNQTRILELDGELFINLEIFKVYITNYERPVMTFTFPDKEPINITIPPNDKGEDFYEIGMDGVSYGASSYVKISALGLTTEENNGMLWIEAQ